MAKNEYSERQKREREFYEEYSKRYPIQEVSFDPILGEEKRPWNPYWFVYEFALTSFKNKNQKLLDFGCGSGIASIRFAKIGYEVYGFDISESNIELAKSLSLKYGLEKRTYFSIQIAEKLNYPNDFFDIVIGIDILHHVEIKLAIDQCFRLLKKGGVAIFKEQIEVPLLDGIRNTELVKHFVPKGKSFERHITEDERKLNPFDLSSINKRFPKMSCHRFALLSRFDQFLRKPESPKVSWLEKIDYFLFKAIPSLSFLGGMIVIKLKKE